MPLRSQLNTDVYSGMRKKNNLGDVLSLVQGAQGVYDNFNTLRRQKKEEQKTDKAFQDEQYLNTTFGKHLTGWDGNPDDLKKRTSTALQEVYQYDPTLYTKANDMMNSQVQSGMETRKGELGLQREEIGLNSDRLNVNRDRIKREKEKVDLDSTTLKYKLAQNNLLTDLFYDVETPEEYSQRYLYGTAQLGKLNLPDPSADPGAAQKFLQNKYQYIDKIKANENQLLEQEKQLKMRQQKAKTGTAEKELNWYDRKMQASIDAANNKGTPQGKPLSQTVALGLSATKQGLDMLDELVTKSDTFKSLSNSPLDKLRSKNPWDKDVQAFNQMIAVTKQVIGKGLEGGVLRKEDEAKYEKILPRLSDPINIRKKKAEQLRQMLVNKYNTDLETLGQGGVDVSKFGYQENKYYLPPDPSKPATPPARRNPGVQPVSDDDLYNSIFGGGQ